MSSVEVWVLGSAAQRAFVEPLLPCGIRVAEGAAVVLDARALPTEDGMTEPIRGRPPGSVTLTLFMPGATGPKTAPFPVSAEPAAIAAALPLAAAMAHSDGVQSDGARSAGVHPDGAQTDGAAPTPAAAIEERDELVALLDALPFPLWTRDGNDVCRYANRAARTRWPRIIGRSPESTPVAEREQRLWTENHERARHGETVSSEVVGADGQPASSLIFPFDHGSKADWTAGVVLELGDHRDQREQLALRDEVLGVLFEHAPFAIGVRRVQDGDILHVADNPVAARLFGTTPGKLVGQTEQQLGIAAEVVERTIAYMSQAKASGRPIDFRLDAQIDGRDRVFTGKLAHVSELEPGDHYVFVAEDQTDLDALKSHLIHAERLASLGTMAASISHEIANPASFVVMNLQLAIEDLERLRPQHPAIDEADIVTLLRASLDGVRRMARIVGDLRQLARPDGSGAVREDLNRIVESVLGLMAVELRRRADLQLELGDVPPVRVNALRTGQVVLNLLKNAVEALEDQPAGENLVRIRTRHSGPWVELEIVDNGPGLPRDVQTNLFQAFSVSRAGGSGLGLYVCKQIVQASGGEIELASRDEGGVRALVRLPVAS